MKKIVIFALLALAGCHQRAPDIVVGDAWTRATAPGQSTAAIYLTIANKGTGTDSLVGVDTPRAGAASLHQMSMDGGVMRMRELPAGLELRPGDEVKLAPSGTHVMLTDVRSPLIAGEQVEARLRFARSGDRTISVRVEAAGAR